MSWQKPARIGVALVGLSAAAAVYLTMGERRSAPPSPPIPREDARAIVEITGSDIERFVGTRKDFEVKGTNVLMGYYEDGSKKLTGNPVRIIVHKGDSRTVEVAGREVRISNDENSFELAGPVKLLDSDGFWLETDRATVNRSDSIAHVPGAATFGKGRMTGSGVGFSYDETRQVLLISKQARVKTVDDAGKTVMEMASGTAMLDRLQHFLTLDTSVHVLRDNQVIDTDAANGRLNANNDVVTYVELHGNARVTGGTSIEAMSARDISLDYTEDGKTLEAVKMAGGATVAMTGETGKPGRRIAGEEMLDLTLAADGKLTSVMARKNVSLGLPAAAETRARTITAQALDGTGEAGKGLTSATFTGAVLFKEDPLPAQGTGAENKGGQRTAQAQKLEASMANDAITAATFTGDATFEETGLKGCAARVEYQPQKDSLSLSGTTKGNNPIVAEEQVANEAESIEVTLESRVLRARGNVQTFMRTQSAQRCRPAVGRAPNEQGARNVPKLLRSDAAVTVSAKSLEYNSRTGLATYAGAARLVQEETSITGEESIVIDQSKGDLAATGKVVSRFMLDKTLSTGLAHELRYSDEKRRITFASAPKVVTGEVSLVSGQGSRLKASNIELTLGAKENTVEQMSARRNVSLTEGMYTVTGASTLDYIAANEEYIVRSDGTTPVLVVTREDCRQFSGDKVTFYKGNDKPVRVEGGQTRTGQTAPLKTACTPSTR